jgi:phosphohistidine phosphatase
MEKKPPSWYEQSAVLAYHELEEGVRIVLITSWSGKHWIIPKGIVEEGMHPADSAAKEALEEAGVLGQVESQPLGSYQYQKWGGTCTVKVFRFKIEEILDAWAESSVRQRRFVSPEEAVTILREPELKEMIERFFPKS